MRRRRDMEDRVNNVFEILSRLEFDGPPIDPDDFTTRDNAFLKKVSGKINRFSSRPLQDLTDEELGRLRPIIQRAERLAEMRRNE